LPTIISPRAYVSKYSKVGKGSVVMHDAIEKFRSPHLWHKINGAWKLKKPIWEEGDFK